MILKNPKETFEYGKKLAGELNPNTVIALTGDLGAGKTTLAQAIAKGLGIEEKITSPTFTVVCEYDSGRIPLYHFDVYRVHDSEELFEIGLEDYFKRGGICLIEWADLIEGGILPDDTINIKLEYGENDEERILTII